MSYKEIKNNIVVIAFEKEKTEEGRKGERGSGSRKEETLKRLVSIASSSKTVAF